MVEELSKDEPYLGQRVWLGGEIVAVIDGIHGNTRVIIQLDKCKDPVTVIWSGDGGSVVFADEQPPAED